MLGLTLSLSTPFSLLNQTLGSQLVSGSVGDWTPFFESTLSQAAAKNGANGNDVLVTPVAGADYRGASQTITVESGSLYYYDLYADNGDDTDKAVVKIGTGADDDKYLLEEYLTSGRRTGFFWCEDTSLILRIQCNVNGLSAQCAYNISIKKVLDPSLLYWTPAHEPSTALWLEANAATITHVSGRVSRWDGMDGGNFVTQADVNDQPLYEATGLDGVYGSVGFDTDDGMTLDQPIGISGTTLYGSGVTWVMLGEINDQAQVQRTIFGGNNGAMQARVRDGEEFEISRQAQISTVVRATGTIPVDQPVILSCETFDRNGGTRVYIDAANEGSANTASYSAGIQTIGNIAGNPAIGFDDKMTSLIILNDESVAKRHALEGYLAHTFDQETRLPISHDYKTRPPIRRVNINLLCDGNSIVEDDTTHTTPAYSWPRQISRLKGFLGGILAANYGVSGQTTQQMIADMATQLPPHLANDRPNVLCAMEIRNDITQNNLTGRQALDNFWTYCDNARVQGWKVVAVAPLPVDTSTQQGIDVNTAITDAYNLMLTEWTDHADAFVDIRVIPGLQDVNNATYYSTFAHPNALGSSLIASAVLKEISRFSTLV